MTSCLFNTCCGCIELRKGCLIIGYMSLIEKIFFIISGFAVMNMVLRTPKVEGAVVALIIVSLIVMFFYFAFIIVLLVGIHKNKRGPVKTFLIAAAIFLVLGIIITVASFAAAPGNGGSNGANIATSIVSYILSVYFLLVIRSYYYKMNDGIEPAVLNTA